MSNLTETQQNTVIQPTDTSIGQLANKAAQANLFGDYQSRKAKNTLRRQRADLALFAEFLEETGDEPGDLFNDAQAWYGITWGLVSAFVRWMLHQGYSVSSVNVRLSTIKCYAKLAFQAGSLDAQAFALIKTVQGYRRKEAKRIDEDRTEAAIPTRVGHKAAAPVVITPAQAAVLKRSYDDVPQGRRDAVLMTLLIDHGLRCGEVAGLKINHIRLDETPPMMEFYRSKVDKEQRHELTPDSLAALRRWLTTDAPAIGPLLRGSRKGGKLSNAGMSVRAITARVRHLGQAMVGVSGLSAHDLRHYWATAAARNGTPIDRLQDAGGWASPAMPLAYIEAAVIANKGVRLD